MTTPKLTINDQPQSLWRKLWGVAEKKPAPMSEAGQVAVARTDAARKAVFDQAEIDRITTAAAPANIAGPTTTFLPASYYSQPSYYSHGGGMGWDSDWQRRNDLDEVAPGVFQGGALSLLPAGIDAVVNVDGMPDQFPTWQLRQLQGAVWFPIGDAPGEAPSIAWLGHAVNAIERFREQRYNVFVHCAMGISRSGMVTVAYVMKKDRLSVEAALAKVRKGRPCTHPNSGFLRSLAAWQKHLGIAGPATVAAASAPVSESELYPSMGGNGQWGSDIPAPKAGEKRVPCPSCGHLYVHAAICALDPDGIIRENLTGEPPTLGESIGEIVARKDAAAVGADYNQGTGLPQISGTPAAAPAGADGEDDWVGGDGTGNATTCGSCGETGLVIAQFEQAYWCPYCLQEEDDHREALADATKADRAVTETLKERVA